MRQPNLLRRGALLIPSGTSNDPARKHLHLICTDPDATARQILVSISTVHPGCDDTCILLRHEHGWLTKERSFVEYRWAKLRPHAELVHGLEQGVFRPMEDIAGQAFLRVCRGIERSPHTPAIIKNHFQKTEEARRRLVNVGDFPPDADAAAGVTAPQDIKPTDAAAEADRPPQ